MTIVSSSIKITLRVRSFSAAFQPPFAWRQVSGVPPTHAGAVSSGIQACDRHADALDGGLDP